MKDKFSHESIFKSIKHTFVHNHDNVVGQAKENYIFQLGKHVFVFYVSKINFKKSKIEEKY